MRSAVQSGNVFDFGVIDNQSIAAWDHKAALQPIAKLPWNGPAMFLMSHPNEVPTDQAVSVYVLLEENGMLLITELMFVSASSVFLLYQSHGQSSRSGPTGLLPSSRIRNLHHRKRSTRRCLLRLWVLLSSMRRREATLRK